MKIETIQVSRDRGKTWSEEEIDITKVKVEECSLKPGDIILRDGKLYEIYHVALARYIDSIEQEIDEGMKCERCDCNFVQNGEDDLVCETCLLELAHWEEEEES